MEKQPNICIIGAGPCGITSAKNMLKQGLINITVFEKNQALGGNWLYNEANNHSSVYETTHAISSKWLSEFEDFPMPSDYPDYPSHSQLLSYFQNYAEHFGVMPFIRFNTTVKRITHEDSGQWRVEFQDKDGDHTAFYDYLLVSNGHHWDPYLPTYPGTFSGEILHSHQYKKAAPFKGKRVLVVGAGNSGCDVAVEVSRIAAKSAISMRRGQHIFPKFIFGKPTDVAFARVKWMPSWLKQRFSGLVIRLVQGRYTKYKLQTPDCKPLEIHPTINSELLYFIRHGKIAPKPGIDRLDGENVYFTDGSVEAFDTIIFATGYRTTFPFFDKEFIEFSTLKQIPLYRKMIHPKIESLFFIGLFQPQGCIWPLADHQAHIAAKLIKGTLKRPSDLTQKIEEEIKHAKQSFRQTIRHALEVDYHVFRRQLLSEFAQDKK